MLKPQQMKARMAAIKAKLYIWEDDPNISKAALTAMIYNLLNYHASEAAIKEWMVTHGVPEPK